MPFSLYLRPRSRAAQNSEPLGNDLTRKLGAFAGTSTGSCSALSTAGSALPLAGSGRAETSRRAAVRLVLALFSGVFGRSYDKYGFSESYVVMSVVILVATILASLLMGDDKGREAPTGELADGADEVVAPAR